MLGLRMTPEERARAGGAGWLLAREEAAWVWAEEERRAKAAAARAATKAAKAAAKAGQQAPARAPDQMRGGEQRPAPCVPRGRSPFDAPAVPAAAARVVFAAAPLAIEGGAGATQGPAKQLLRPEPAGGRGSAPTPSRSASASSTPLMSAAAAAGAAVQAAAAPPPPLVLQRRGPTWRTRVLWNSARAAALAAPSVLTFPAAAAASALLPASVAAAGAPFAAALAPLVGMTLPFLLALPPAAVGLELFGVLLRKYAVERTYCIGQQWVLTAQGLEPALKPMDRYPRDWRSFGAVKGFFPGHRMVAYRNRLIKLLPGDRLSRRASARPVAAAAAAAVADAQAASGLADTGQ
ncbi:hypothetical protein MNEG_14609 [Monoraphidium neglectum]|uniref:Uncharacterized protein n=1 Tax=Monoraphidium neglectum TaxID=145388 RepID=A0A0D2IZR8_9CHLO|nr:hypothetical protein MNEG_14609 [Monoraphidium neglectum]KIY93352.1 hypothetical protein MNEG_14609 [Monoraphidium neglectum]|eukprot:XP_013892372.1 hypothetical protein MNEG_14609 [Monoraphidium neglectum]